MLNLERPNAMKNNLMRSLCLLLPLFFIVISSCKQDPIINDQNIVPITFQVPDSMEMTIPKVLNINWLPFDLPIIPVGSSVDESVDNLNPLIDLVENIFLNEMKMTITSPGRTFDFLQDIKIYATSPQVQGEQLMAYHNSIPTNVGNVLELTPVANKLDDYLKNEFAVRVEVTVRKIFFEDIDIKTNMLMDVTLIND